MLGVEDQLEVGHSAKTVRGIPMLIAKIEAIEPVAIVLNLNIADRCANGAAKILDNIPGRAGNVIITMPFADHGSRGIGIHTEPAIGTVDRIIRPREIAPFDIAAQLVLFKLPLLAVELIRQLMLGSGRHNPIRRTVVNIIDNARVVVVQIRIRIFDPMLFICRDAREWGRLGRSGLNRDVRYIPAAIYIGSIIELDRRREAFVGHTGGRSARHLAHRSR